VDTKSFNRLSFHNNKNNAFHANLPPNLFDKRSLAQSSASPYSTSKIVSDSGCKDMLFKHSSAHYLHNRTPSDQVTVTVANNQCIKSIGKGVLIIPTKTGDIKLKSHVFRDGELSNNLAGLSNLCNEGCSILLNSEFIAVSRDDEII
jgi:hypothetical protein